MGYIIMIGGGMGYMIMIRRGMGYMKILRSLKLPRLLYCLLIDFFYLFFLLLL